MLDRIITRSRLVQIFTLAIVVPAAFFCPSVQQASAQQVGEMGEMGEHNLIMGTGELREPQTFTREQRMLDAVRNGDRATVEAALKLGVAVDTADDLQRSALLLAARDAGDLELVRFLHGRGAKIDAPDTSGRTPLSYSASAGRLDLASYLAEQGAEVDRHDRRGRTPLFHAVLAGHAEMVAWLLDRGAAIDAADRHGDTPFIMACAKGDRAIADLLIARGADRSARNKLGRSAEDRATTGLDLCRLPNLS